MAGASATDAVWIDVLPSMRGFGPALAQGTQAEADKVGKDTGGRFGKALLAGVAVVAGGAALAAKALYNIGATFDDVSDTIRVGTGATGKALDSLVGVAKNVGKQVPAEFSSIGTTVADLNTRLGLTGKPLEHMASQFLELSRITGTDVATNIKNVSRVFGDAGIATGDQSKALDYLFKVSQSTGIGLDELTTKVVQYGAPMRQFGFTFEESAALMGKWAREGVNTETIMSGLRQGLGKLAKSGKEPAAALKEVEERIKNAGSAGEATSIAIETFGQRAGPDMAAAVREGRFELDDLMGSLKNSSETILGAGADTMDFAEKWQMFKNKVLLVIEPIASRVFSAMGDGMDWVAGAASRFAAAWSGGGATDAISRLGSIARSVFDYIKTSVVPTLASLGGWIKDNATWLVPLTAAVVSFAAALKVANTVQTLYRAGMQAYAFWTYSNAAATGVFTTALNAMKAAFLTNPIGIIIAALVALGVGFVLLWKNSETFRNIVMGALHAVADAGVWMWENVLKPVWNALKAAWDGVATGIAWAWNNLIKPAWDAISAAASWLWNSVLQPVFSAISTAWNALATGIKWAWDNILLPVFNVLKAVAEALGIFLAVVVFGPILIAWKLLSEGIKLYWEYILQPVLQAVATVAQWLWTNVLQPVFGWIQAGWNALVTAMQWAWNNILKPVWDAISAAANWLWKTVLNVIFTAIQFYWNTILTAMSWAWNNILKPVWDAISSAAQFLWNNVLKPVFGFIKDAWDGLGTAFRWVWDNLLKPVFDTFSRVIDTVKNGFQTAVDGIKGIWEGMKEILRAPVQWVIDVVWNNGLRKLWNWINNLWGGDDLPVFQFSTGGTYAPTGSGTSGSGGRNIRMATGGVLPGYTPGRDVHKFISPTGGLLELSGGEAIMRPEFTRAIGIAGVNQLNDLAMREGVSGLRKVLGGTAHVAPGAYRGDPPSPQAFAKGGVVSLPGWLKWPLKFLPGGSFLTSVLDSINGGGEGKGGWGDMIWGMVKKTASNVWDKAKSLFGFGDNTSDGTAGNFGKALGFARSQVGKPYVWGATGPGGYDCSGFMSAITNVIEGRSPYSRVGATSSFPWRGFRPGVDGPFTIGSSRNTGDGIGHMAGTLLGVNVESRGGSGVHVGPDARGAHDRLFNIRAGLFDQGGLWKSGTAGFNLTGGVERVLTPSQDDYFQRFVNASERRDQASSVDRAPINLYTPDIPHALRALRAEEQQREALAPTW